MSKAIAGKKAAAFSAAFAIALSAGVVGADATVAQAQENPAPSTEQQKTTDYSVTIHKYKGTEDAEQGTGKEKNMGDKTPAEGVEYELQLVKKIENASDYPEAVKIAESDEEPTVLETIKSEKATDEHGVLEFNNLDKGLYRVVETKVGEKNPDLVIAKPFYVFVPMTNPKDKSENIKNVHVYPKNSEVTIDKEVDDMHKNAGQDYTYTINTTVPAAAEGENLTEYVVQDTLDSKLDASVDGSSVEVTYDGDTLNGDDYDVVRDGQTISVEFTKAGLAKLKDSNAKVHTKITTKTKEAVKHVPNHATLITNHPRFKEQSKKDSNEVHTYWGNIKVTKKADSEEGDLLGGATFQLVQCVEQGENNWIVDPKNTTPLKVDGETSWTTPKDGEDKGTITIKGIHATDYADDSDAEEKKANYCLQETEAPAGYAPTDELYHFELTKSDIEKSIAADKENGGVEAIEWEKTVVNYSDKNFLPNTGGAGFIAIVMAGLAIIGGGFFAARRNSVKA